MNIKISDLFKKITIVLVIAILCSSSAVHAFSFGIGQKEESSGGIISSLISKLFNIGSYDMEDLNKDFLNMKDSGNIDMDKISELINKLPTGEDKDILEYIKEMFSMNDTENSESSILDTLLDAITSLLGSSSSSSLPVEPVSITMDAKTAVEFAGDDYAGKLHANVYINENSDKWVVLIHPFMLKGQTIANKVGPYYYEKGYNILAPDLRGFGDSEGSVALGFLESLDVYDWLNKLNAEYNPDKVFVHGISLGGATTNFLSGIDGFINNGPTKIDTQIKSLRELKVVGLVEDCGYTDMEQFADKSFLMNLGIGLTDDNFDYYSKATNSLKYCDIPILIIHGTSDTTVDPENADTVKNTVKGEARQWLVDGGAHAFIIMGSNSDEYKANVQQFIADYENTATERYEPPTDIDKEEDVDVKVEVEKEDTGSFFDKIINALKSFKIN